ncbi:TerC family protein [Salipaludibacillus sp. LMS25]|uniref:TerC family protein n=1 Tax=Salipaludibacillus sp. LMS25 TaxID=2924031 RepID=UPI0020D13ADF|nr:TerC family protein [Salipaludibacillus sp. LMS25]UTR15352.1 TerC family protein [Salipaludibacillus sp. LMS25]
MTTETIWALLTIIGIDIVLGGDNAIVVAMACRRLPKNLRNKAIVLGIMLAVLARGILTILAVHLLAIPYLMGIGGVFLVWIAFRLINTENNHSSIHSSYTISDAIKTIVIADVVMGFDNVLAVAGASQGNSLLVLTGLIISIPIIIWGSKIILYLMTRFPLIIYIGAAVLLFTAGKMILHEHLVQAFLQNSLLSPNMFLFSLVGGGLLVAWLSHHINGLQILFFRQGR